MKIQRYISTLLLLLFAFAFSGRALFAFECHCAEESAPHHVCCHNPAHAHHHDCDGHHTFFTSRCVVDDVQHADDEYFSPESKRPLVRAEVALHAGMMGDFFAFESAQQSVDQLFAHRYVLYDSQRFLLCHGLRAPPVLA